LFLCVTVVGFSDLLQVVIKFSAVSLVEDITILLVIPAISVVCIAFIQNYCSNIVKLLHTS